MKRVPESRETRWTNLCASREWSGHRRVWRDLVEIGSTMAFKRLPWWCSNTKSIELDAATSGTRPSISFWNKDTG